MGVQFVLWFGATLKFVECCEGLEICFKLFLGLHVSLLLVHMYNCGIIPAILYGGIIPP
jgi:hypothetical protein